MPRQRHIIVIGAGAGGLSSALRLLATGAKVTVMDALDAPGGKMRTVPSEAGPVDAGPTVLTMRYVFDDLFGALGERLEDHVTLDRAETLARHFWSDGTRLDLDADQDVSFANVQTAFGAVAAREFMAFSLRAKRLFETFDAPMMRSAGPSQAALTFAVMRHPKTIFAMAPHLTLNQVLRHTFSEPKLQQLFGRYATYVGGSPYQSPALLSLIWHAEHMGVWAVRGGIHQLACAMARLAQDRGASFAFGTTVERIETCPNGVRVHAGGSTVEADAVVFNGDPRALTMGKLGAQAVHAVATEATQPRSLSANVMAFAATPKGVPLSHHNVFFGEDPLHEFGPISNGRDPEDPTLYVCAQDRGGGHTPNGPERFEIIMNAPPCTDTDTRNEEKASTCQTHILTRLSEMGLTLSPMPTAAALTQPADFHRLFPGSLGSLYGRSPHGMTAGLKRPRARTAVRGLYLAGGGAHPGAGVPMATLSGQHAAEAIMQDLDLTSTFQQTATRGGISTDCLSAEHAPSLSSRS